ncbi:hypothetical protein KQH56_03705 [bacterium]|nr:hypothetical protein [bacterium]
MENEPKKKSKRWILYLVIALVLVIGVITLILVVTKPMPVALLSEYGKDMLWKEGNKMVACGECHASEEFHGCSSCHDDHGAVELSGITFFEVVQLTGDVPDPSFVRVNEVLPDQKNTGTHITVLDFLALHGVEADAFESITLMSSDGGLVTIEAQYIDETAMLLPYVDGLRFASETVHVSTWLKGISRIVVVGTEKPLVIDGEATSIGRLLIGETARLTLESTDVMLANDAGETSHAQVANSVEGAPLLPLLADANPDTVIVTNSAGETFELTSEEIASGAIAMVYDEITLVLPDRGRSAWLTDIVEIESN